MYLPLNQKSFDSFVDLNTKYRDNYFVHLIFLEHWKKAWLFVSIHLISCVILQWLHFLLSCIMPKCCILYIAVNKTPWHEHFINTTHNWQFIIECIVIVLLVHQSWYVHLSCTSVLKQSFTNDSTCENKRIEYYKLLNIYRHNNTVEKTIQMINARKHYKTV